MGRILSGCLTIILCIGHPGAQTALCAQAQNANPSPYVPLAKDGPMYSATINKAVERCGLLPLQQIRLPEGSQEIRIWEGFGDGPLNAYVLHRTKGIWSAVALLPMYPNYANQQYRRILPVPRSGWAAFWSEAQKSGLLTLPDSATLPGEKRVFDGISYVVEIRDGSKYCTYHYGNPQLQVWPEAKRMVKIAELLHKEFPAPP